MKKKLVKMMAITMLAVFTLVGCAGNNAAKTDSSAAPAKTDTAKKEEAPKVDAAKEYVINFPSIWVGKDSKANMMNTLIEEFNQANAGKIKIIVEEIADYDAYTDKMRTNIAAGTVPDIFTFKHGAQADLYFKSGKLMDLTPYMNEGWKDQFLGDAINAVTFDSKVMAVPYEFGVTPVMYNKALFEKAGVMEFPKNYDEFFAACDKLKAAGITPMSQMTGANAWTSMLWYSQLLHSIGGPDVYKNGFDDPAFVEAARVMQKMFKYTTDDAVGATAAIAGGHFLTGETAMLMNGPWFIGRIKTEGANDMYESVEAAPAPYYEGGKGQSGGYIGFIQADIGVAKQDDKGKEEAVIKFLKYITEPENVKRVSLDSGALFVVKFDLGNEVERLQGQMNAQLNAAPYAIPHLEASVKPAVASEFPQALSGMILGELTPEQFVEQLKVADEM